MSVAPTPITPELFDYVVRVGVREPEPMRRVRDDTAALPQANMQIAPDQAAFMALLVELMGARRCLELGTFTGYSALAVALAMPPDGRIVACDVSREWTDIARRHWEAAGVADRIELRLGPALETLDALLAHGAEGTFDFAFIDADKQEYPAYYERVLRLLRPGGLMAIDNVLWDGEVINPDLDDADVRAIRALNEQIHADERVRVAMTTIADGLTLALKRG
jgi:predicted O-methyltransferase YrrM